MSKNYVKSGGVALSKKELMLITINSFNSAAFTFGNYLVAKWTVSLTGGIESLLWQFGMQIVPSILMYFFAIKLLHKARTSTMLSMSFALFILAYSLFFVGVKLNFVMVANILFGIFYGLANGTFWGCSNNLSITLTTRESRPRYLAFNGLYIAVASIVAPSIMLVLVGAFNGKDSIPELVYTLFFVITLLCYTITFVLAYSLKLPKYDIKYSFKDMKFSEPLWRKFLALGFLYGAYHGMPDALSGIMLIAFLKYTNTFYLAMLVLSIGVNILGNYLFSKKFYARNRLTLYYVCVVVSVVNYIALSLTYKTVISGVVGLITLFSNALFVVLRKQSENMLHIEVIDSFAKNDVERSGRFFIREISLVAGRMFTAIAMLVTGLFFLEPTNIILVVSLCFGGTSVLTIILTEKYFKDFL